MLEAAGSIRLLGAFELSLRRLGDTEVKIAVPRRRRRDIIAIDQVFVGKRADRP